MVECVASSHAAPKQSNKNHKVEKKKKQPELKQSHLSTRGQGCSQFTICESKC